MAKDTVDLVGGFDNITDIDNCITRVRLSVKDNSNITREAAQAIGYTGYVKTGKLQAHFIIGAESEIIANEIRKLKEAGYTGAAKKTTAAKKPASNLNSKTVAELKAMAKEAGVKGYTSMTKAALIKALN
jgi:PTS system N-acetylglucosamine-specific IIC component